MKASVSEPKFKPVYTPRIKDGRPSNDNTPLKNNFMTAQKLTYDNPESPQKYNKFEMVQTQANSPVKGVSRWEPAKPKVQAKERVQQTFNGRKLEYPHPAYQKPTKASQPNNQAPRMQRSQSANLSGSRHFVDRSIKSREIIQKQAIDEQKMRVAMNYLLGQNGDYLAERRRVCNQKAKPKEQIFKIQLANTISTYTEHYPPKEAPYQFQIQPQNEKCANSFGPRKVCGNSTTRQVHNGKQGPKADLATWPDGFKLEGPIDGTTTYANHYPDHGDFQKMVPVAKFDTHPSGLKFRPNTTHKDFHDGKQCQRSDLMVWNNGHPYGNEFNPKRGTTYRSQHNSKQKHPIQQWPNYDPRLIVSKGKFSTEYKTEMVRQNQHELNGENYCNCGHCGHKGRKRIYN